MTQAVPIRWWKPGRPVKFTLDGRCIEAPAGVSLLAAAQAHGIYIPALCAHPDLPPPCGDQASNAADNAGGTCGLCLVEVIGAGVDGIASHAPTLRYACTLPASAGLDVASDTPVVRAMRQAALARLLATHPHVCLTCPQREGCNRTLCSYGHASELRCCAIFDTCELRRVADHVGISPATPAYRPTHDPGMLPTVHDEPLYDRDYNLCIDCRRCLTACNTVRGVACLEVKETGQGGGGVRRWVGPIAATLLESGCKFCNACVDVCPTGALRERNPAPPARIRHTGEGTREAPCAGGCPAGIDVPRYVQLAGLGRYAEANAVVREKLPFPGILGRVCFAPCESVCRRGQLDDPLSIRSLKRIAADHDDGRWRARSRRAPPSGQRVAVVGAGLAGLTVAYYLAKKGHAVTVFEADTAAGGMARQAIPDWRLPRAVIEAEVAEVARLGVDFRFNTRIDDLDVLMAQRFAAVFLGIGAQAAERLGIPGDNLPEVMDSLSFLRGRPDMSGRHVAVIGGGNVACDDARGLLRCGAARVDLVYRRSAAEMPARAGEVAACRAEGVNLRFHVTPLRIESATDGGARTLRIAYASLSGSEAIETVETVDGVIAAVGQRIDCPAGFGLDTDATGRIAVREETLLTSRPGVFAGGDAVLGPASLIEAVAQGRRAAMAIDRHLGGDGDIEETLCDSDWQTDPYLGREDGFNRRHRLSPPQHVPAGKLDWNEVEQCYTDAEARTEGLRCLKCNLSAQCAEAMLPPPAWQTLDAATVSGQPATSGVFRLFDADGRLLVIRGVIDLRAALEAMLSAAGQARYFDTETAHYFSQRETERLQEYMARHGAMPPGTGGGESDALDDLF